MILRHSAGQLRSAAFICLCFGNLRSISNLRSTYAHDVILGCRIFSACPQSPRREWRSMECSRYGFPLSPVPTLFFNLLIRSFLLGHCYLMQDDLQKAYSAYQQALYLLPNPKVCVLYLTRLPVPFNLILTSRKTPNSGMASVFSMTATVPWIMPRRLSPPF